MWMHARNWRLCALGLVMVVAACGDDDPTGVDEPLPEVTAQFPGVSFSVPRAIINRVSGQVFMRATDEELRTLNFQLPDEGPGTYTMGPGADVTVGVQIGPMFWDANDLMGDGAIVVTVSTETRFAGTFHFTLLGPEPPSPFQVTEGRFDIEIRGVFGDAVPHAAVSGWAVNSPS